MAKRNTTMRPITEGEVVGMDVGDLWSEVCVMDASGEVTQEARVRTREAAMKSYFERMAPRRIVLEAGGQSPWIQRLLKGLGHDAIVVNPHRVRLIAESLVKDDRRDAILLADLGRMAPMALHRVEHRSAQEQVDLAVLRVRALVVKQRSMNILHVRGVVKACGGRLEGCTVERFSQLAAPQIAADLRSVMYPLLGMISEQTKLIREYDKKVAELIVARYPEAKAMQQICGVGPITALHFRLSVGDPRRFARSRQVGPYFGLVPARRQSGGRDPGLGITKSGDGEVRHLLVQCAQYILSHTKAESALREWGLKKAEGGRRARQRAVVAVARKLAVLMHHLWVSGEAYERFPGREAA